MHGVFAYGTQVVEAYTRQEQEISAGYKLVAASKYEKEFPGRIARKKLVVKPYKCDGKMVDCVLVRTAPEGEWDFAIKDISGVVLSKPTQQTMTAEMNNRGTQRRLLTEPLILAIDNAYLGPT